MSQVSEEERYAQKQSRFYGSAKIHLKHLVFPQLSNALTLDAKNIERLTQIFRLEGCQRLDIEHHVPAVINDDILSQCLHHSGLGLENLRRQGSPPSLEFPENFTLECLHGKHRIAAAKDILLPGNKWWIVDLYSDGLEDRVVQDIREEYANSRNFCDGDIFRQIRHAQCTQNLQAELRWLARLSEGKRKDLRQLQRRLELRPLAGALDNLLPYIGFWPSLQIGTFHRVLNLKCPEELQHYLDHVRTCWDRILGSLEPLRPQVDFGTVRLLQTRNPGTSNDDKVYITHVMETNQLFPMITDPTLRSQILQRVLETSCMIPSLYTFFEDTKWLEPCAKIMRGLLPPGCRESTRHAFFRAHNGSTMRRIQSGPGRMRESAGREAESVEVGYLQLWMCAWRHFPELSGIMPRKDIGLPKPQAKTSNLRCRHQLAELAANLGFSTTTISQFLRRNPDMDMARTFLEAVRPEQLYQMSGDAREQISRRICEVLSMAIEPTTRQSQTVTQPEISVDRRCGRPHEQSHNDSKSHFFFPIIYGNSISSFSYLSINRDIFHAFFGSRLSHPNRDEDHMMADEENTVGDVGQRSNMGANSAVPVSSSEDHAMDDNPEASVENAGMTNPGTTGHLQNSTSVDISGRESAALPNNGTSNTNGVSTIGPAVTYEEAQQQNGGALTRMGASQDTVQDGSVVRLGQPPNPNPDSLYYKWRTTCQNGDLFIVEIDAVRCRNYPGGVLPAPVMNLASTHVFAAYRSPSCRCVRFADLSQYARGTISDGVVYCFQRQSPFSTYRVRGQTTEERLNEIEIWISRRQEEEEL